MRIYIKNIFKEKNNNIQKKKEKYRKVKKENDKKIKNEIKEKSKIESEEKNDEKNKMVKSYYFLFFLMIGLAGISVKFAIKEYSNYYEEDYAVFNSEDNVIDNTIEKNNKDNDLDILTNNTDTRDVEESSINSSDNSVINNIQKKANNIVVKENPLEFQKPIDTEIQKIYSDDKVIYSKTLDMWKTHDGIDYSGSIGDDVYSSEKGVIEKIYDDAFYGTTIVINHGQGYKTSYSNLDKETYVKNGEKVKKNQKIGKIGNTSIGEIKDLPHIHFMMYKDDRIINPSSVLK